MVILVFHNATTADTGTASDCSASDTSDCGTYTPENVSATIYILTSSGWQEFGKAAEFLKHVVDVASGDYDREMAKCAYEVPEWILFPSLNFLRTPFIAKHRNKITARKPQRIAGRWWSGAPP